MQIIHANVIDVLSACWYYVEMFFSQQGSGQFTALTRYE
jgi:hypothetical protein